ncbi:hypothetical protein PLANPX_4191 [Lacipirellula parvula]|uniref:Uncharacterized protein n=1 Tax=Lacipirellula parvula TaxID=2650471 RepID=A0A5K7XN86_9BACT|nr:hypothetical protein PLANPX_4191 [Lacipirellula parvula]
MRFETTTILVGSVPTRIELTASREVWLRPAPDCESDLYVSNRLGVEGFPVPSGGMRFNVEKEGHHVVLYCVARNDFTDNQLHILVR